MTKSNNKQNRISKAFLTILLALMFIMFSLLVGCRLIGLNPYSVMSGSMEPTYHVGSLIYVQTVDTNTIKVGDPITFENSDNSMIVTHRVVSIDTTNQRFYTKGDANNSQDQSPVSFSKVIGHPMFSIPLLGYVAVFVSTFLGKSLVIVFLALILAGLYIPDLVRKSNKSDTEK